MSAPATAPLTDAPRTRAEINRTNAQHSTGPRTPAGKARASMNALKHGLFAQEVVLPGEDREQFEELAHQIAARHRAETDQELSLVQDIVDCRWRIRRVFAHETALILLTTEQQRTSVEQLFEGDDDSMTALARAAGFQANARLFNQISISEMRLFRRAKLAEDELATLVSHRQVQPQVEPKPQPAEQPAPEQAAQPDSGFVPPTPTQPTHPPNMPHFSGPLKKENRRQWLRKHGHQAQIQAA